MISKYPSDLAGLRFGLLTVICKKLNDRPYKTSLWECVCDCGESRVVQRSSLVCGKQVSCGCHNKKRVIETHTKHGLYRHSAYGTWKSMIDRCQNPKAKDYPYYGARGIEVCERWQTIEGFVADMGEKLAGQSIDRIDPDGDYTPANCRWSCAMGQGEHKRNNVMMEYQGKTMHAAAIWRTAGLTESTFYNRIKSGMSVDQATSKPARMRNLPVEIGGVTRTLAEWARLSGLNGKTVRNRYHAGVRGERLIAPPAKGKKTA